MILKDGSHVYSNSELALFDRCPRQWYFKYVLKMKPSQESHALNFGTGIHAILENFYRGDLNRAYDTINSLHHDDRELAGVMLDGYVDYAKQTDAFQVVDVERFITADLADYTLIGIVDLEVKVGSGLWFFDHKTTRNYEALDMLQIDRQARFYALIGDLSGRPYEGVVFNFLKKVKQTTRARPPFYLREQVHLNRHIIANTRQHVLSKIHIIERALEEIENGTSHHYAAPPANNWTCKHCPFSTVCPNFDDGSNIDLEAHTDETFNPLARYSKYMDTEG